MSSFHVELSPDDAQTFARAYLDTGDAARAYMRVKPRARKESASERGPLCLGLPVVADAIRRLRSEAADSVTDDSVLVECRRLLADPMLSARERLSAMTVYDKLRRGIGADAGKGGDTWPGELVEFLRTQGVSVDAG
jgi:hypothetical protein